MLTSLPNTVRADSSSIQVILSSDARYYQQVLDRLSAEFTQQNVDIHIASSTLDNLPATRDDTALIAAIGVRACETALSQSQANPLLCAFLPRGAYQKARERYHPTNSERKVSAIYLDQPWHRYLKLIHILLPHTDLLGVAFSPLEEYQLTELQPQAAEFGISLQYGRYHARKSPADVLTPALNNCDVFLATADPASNSKTTAKWLLYHSIRHRIPVIAYSKSYVKAGALAAIYSSPENIGRDLGEAIISSLSQSQPQLEEPRYPNYYSIQTNPNVARSLSLRLPDNSELIRAIGQYQGMDHVK